MRIKTNGFSYAAFGKPRLLFVAFFLLLVSTLKMAAAPQFRFDSWTTDNGLPQISVNSILQTADGFLWVATFGGLARYDGLRFEKTIKKSGMKKKLKIY